MRDYHLAVHNTTQNERQTVRHLQTLLWSNILLHRFRRGRWSNRRHAQLHIGQPSEKFQEHGSEFSYTPDATLARQLLVTEDALYTDMPHRLWWQFVLLPLRQRTETPKDI